MSKAKVVEASGFFGQGPELEQFNRIVEAQKSYVRKHFGQKVLDKSEFGIGSDGEATYVESVIRTAGMKRPIAGKFAYDRMLTTFVTEADGTTSSVHYKGRPNSLKHVISVIG